jgi:hypothetical protein
MNENAKKILSSLAYRIKVTDKNDPEYENAVRLYERLKAKYGFTDDDLMNRKNREFKDKKIFKQLFIQIFVTRLHGDLCGNDDFNFRSFCFYDKKTEREFFDFELNLTDDEFKLVTEQFEAFKVLYERELKSFIKKQRKELKEFKEKQEQEMKAFRYAFHDKGNLLAKADGRDDEPEFSFFDLVKAAKKLESVVFPQNMVKQEQCSLPFFSK